VVYAAGEVNYLMLFAPSLDLFTMAK